MYLHLWRTIMENVKRIYVEKKVPYAVKAKELKEEIENYLSIDSVENVRELIRYDIENLSEETIAIACKTVFSEPPVDILFEETFEVSEGAKVFSVEYLPGQFDQRADSAVQCVQFLNENENPVIKTAVTYLIEGNVSDEDFGKIKSHLARGDAQPLGVGDGMIDLCAVQEGFGGNTTAVEAGASHVAGFYDGGFESQAGAFDGAHIAARTRADHDNLIIRHFLFLHIFKKTLPVVKF